MGFWRRVGVGLWAAIAATGALTPRAEAQPALSAGCNFVNAYGFPVVWNNVLGGSFSPPQPFNAGEVISVQISWTGGPAATSATFHIYAAGLNVTQSVGASGSINTSYTLPGATSYIDVGLSFLPANVGRGDITLTLSCSAGGGDKGQKNRDSARLAGLVRNMTPLMASMSAQANTDMVLGNVDAVLGGSDNPQASDRGFRVSSYGALAYAANASSAAADGIEAADRSRGGRNRTEPPQWNVWAAGRYTGASGAWPNLGSTRGVNFAGGIDRRIGDRMLAGLFGGFEEFRFWDGFDGAVRGSGPSIGPYLGIRLADYLTFNAMAAYTNVSYRASAGLASGDFRADRFTFAASLTARLRVADVQFEPKAKAQYLTERQSGYLDSLAVYQPGYSFSAGRLSLGSKAAYLGWASGGARFTPWVGAYGDLSFGEQTRVWTPLQPYVSNGLSLRTSVGIDADIGAANLSLSGEYGGIGAAYRTMSGRAALRIGF